MCVELRERKIEIEIERCVYKWECVGVCRLWEVYGVVLGIFVVSEFRLGHGLLFVVLHR